MVSSAGIVALGEAIDKIGFGRYQLCLLLVIGTAWYVADGQMSHPALALRHRQHLCSQTHSYPTTHTPAELPPTPQGMRCHGNDAAEFLRPSNSM